MADEVVKKDICNKEHERVDEKLDHHESWLKEHEDKIDRLDRSDAQKTTQIESLCKQLGGLTKAIWGLVVMVATALLGFFFFAIQTKLFGKG